jgi:hypothetical protein
MSPRQFFGMAVMLPPATLACAGGAVAIGDAFLLIGASTVSWSAQSTGALQSIRVGVPARE